jgi:predicted aspartyl protease
MRFCLPTWIVLIALATVAYAVTLPAIPMHAGWITFTKIDEDNGFKLFRRYGYFRNAKNSVPNLIIFNCSKDVRKAASYLTFILPNDFQPASLPRSTRRPKIDVRFQINDKSSVLMPGEYHNGEFYFDLNIDTSDNFEKIMLADKLAMEFGDKNDVIQYEFTEKIDQLFSTLLKKFRRKFGGMTHYSRVGADSVAQACQAYQQSGSDIVSEETSTPGAVAVTTSRARVDNQPTQGISVSIPMQKESGTYVIPVLINNAITLDFVVDSGAADVSIPADVVSTLFRTGTIKESDFIGTQTYKLGDGTEVPSVRFRLRSLRIGEISVENIVAGLAPAKGNLFLGQSFLGHFRFWAIDNSKYELTLNANLDSQSYENSNDEIADASIRLFDRLCIERAHDKSAFYSVIDKLVQRKLTSEEYKPLLFGRVKSADFHSVAISEKVGDVIIGRMSYEGGAYNCVVSAKFDQKLAEWRWMDLYNKKYATKAKLQEDKGAPLYFVEQGGGKAVMVQIGNLPNGFVLYYTYFQ